MLAQNPGFPDVSQVLDDATNKLPNVYSPIPLADGWASGPMDYYYAKFKSDTGHAGAFLADSPSASQTWAGEKYVAEQAGFKFVSEQTYATTQTDFTQQVIAMRNAGVKIIFMDQMPSNYAGSVLKALPEQDYHPQVLLGAATYSNQLITQSGGAANVNGAYLSQNLALYLGTDERPSRGGHVPPLGPGGVAGVQARPVHRLRLAVGRPVLPALKNAGSTQPGLAAPGAVQGDIVRRQRVQRHVRPGEQEPPNCYLIATVTNGQFVRSPDNPPTTGSTNGFRCDGSYVGEPGT